MKFGVVFPQTELTPDPIVIRDYAQAVEGLGYDYLLTYEHVLGANPDRPGGWAGRPYDYQDSFNEPFVLFGYLAGLTQSLELVTGILILPQRQTVLVAKQAAQVDVLSGGRLRLGIGIGWNEVEYEALGIDFHTRGRRCEEQIALLNDLWTKPLVTFKGKYHSVPDAGLNPLPAQRPIPIWFGGSAEAVLRRMARWGQGWFPGGPVNNERLKEMIDRLHGYLVEAGRDPKTFGIDGRMSLAGKPRSAWASEVEQWREVGATHVAVNTMGAGYTSPEQHLGAIRQFKEEIGI
jgi:probable F420-dependent oxidoreductase